MALVGATGPPDVELGGAALGAPVPRAGPGVMTIPLGHGVPVNLGAEWDEPFVMTDLPHLTDVLTLVVPGDGAGFVWKVSRLVAGLYLLDTDATTARVAPARCVGTWTRWIFTPPGAGSCWAPALFKVYRLIEEVLQAGYQFAATGLMVG